MGSSREGANMAFLKKFEWWEEVLESNWQGTSEAIQVIIQIKIKK